MNGISSRVVELATKYGIVSNKSYDGKYMEQLEQFANEVYYDGVKSCKKKPTNDKAMDCANEIADSFIKGFCNDSMVENFADIIRKYIKPDDSAKKIQAAYLEGMEFSDNLHKSLK